MYKDIKRDPTDQDDRFFKDPKNGFAWDRFKKRYVPQTVKDDGKPPKKGGKPKNVTWKGKFGDTVDTGDFGKKTTTKDDHTTLTQKKMLILKNSGRALTSRWSLISQ